MKELLIKEQTQIIKPIKAYIENTINNGLTTSEGREISKVNEIRISNILVDAEHSEFKVRVFINKLDILANVRVIKGEHAYSNDTLSLMVTNIINLSYNFENKEYVIDNTNELGLIDMTF